MRRFCALVRISSLVVAVGVIGASCKKDGVSQTPHVRDDIAAIEAQLEANADELRANGITIALAAPAAAQGVARTTDEPAPEPPPPQEPTPKEPTTDVPAPLPDTDGEPIIEDADEAPAPAVQSEPSYRNADDEERELVSTKVRRERWLSRRKNKRDATQRCQRVCDLAEATCDLADRICGLAQRHPDEIRYEDACNRAEHHCRIASQACNACAS